MTSLWSFNVYVDSVSQEVNGKVLQNRLRLLGNGARFKGIITLKGAEQLLSGASAGGHRSVSTSKSEQSSAAGHYFCG